MSEARKQNIKVYDLLYRRFYHDPVNRFTCFYCGAPANCFDHQPPISRVPDYQSLGLKHEVYVKVPACNECNQLASNELTETLVHRFNLVKDRLEQKHKRLLKSDEWDESELRTVKGRLKQHIKAKNAELKAIRFRVDYAEGLDAFLMAYQSRDSDFVGIFR